MRDEAPPPDSPLAQEALRWLKKQKEVEEETATYDLLVGELSASRELEQLANYLLAFDGAAAAVALANTSELSKMMGETSVTVALLVLAVSGATGLLIRCLGLRIQAFLRIGKEVRESTILERQTRKRPIELLPELLSSELPDDESEAVKELKTHIDALTADYEAAFAKFQERYISTLSSIGKWLERRRAKPTVDSTAHLRRLLGRQHWQRRLLMIQAALTVGLVLAAGVQLGVGLLR